MRRSRLLYAVRARLMARGNHLRGLFRHGPRLLRRRWRLLWLLWLLWRLLLMLRLRLLLGNVGRVECVVVIVLGSSLGYGLGGKLLLGGGGYVQSWVHAESSLGCTGGRGRVGCLGALLRRLLERIEVGNVNAIGSRRFGGLDGTLDVGRSVTGGHGHVGRGSGALSTLHGRTAGLPLPLLARRPGQLGEIWLFGHNWLAHVLQYVNCGSVGGSGCGEKQSSVKGLGVQLEETNVRT